MASYFYLELDTTPPILRIYIPQSVINFSTFQVVIESNEDLMNCQEIYIEDSVGVRHDLVFFRESNRVYKGRITLDDYPLGKAILHVTLQDTVKNSTKESKSFQIIEESSLKIINGFSSMKIKDEYASSNVKSSTKTMKTINTIDIK